MKLLSFIKLVSLNVTEVIYHLKGVCVRFGNEYIIERDPSISFRPLIGYMKQKKFNGKLIDNALCNYMYMYHDEKNYYFYKHRDTRLYVVIKVLESGVFRKQIGYIDITDFWELYGNDSVIDELSS